MLGWHGSLRARMRSAGGPAGLSPPLAEWFASPGFHGCAFINCAAEFPDPKHPVRRVAREHKEALRAAVADACRAGSVDTKLAPALYLLVEGAIVAALVGGGTEPARAAKRAALDLVDTRHSR
jgi:hypothetical protein